jgi:hypothetical protein
VSLGKLCPTRKGVIDKLETLLFPDFTFLQQRFTFKKIYHLKGGVSDGGKKKQKMQSPHHFHFLNVLGHIDNLFTL